MITKGACRLGSRCLLAFLTVCGVFGAGDGKAYKGFLESNQHYYEYVRAEGIGWGQAIEGARAHKLEGIQGHLVAIGSQEENDFVTRIIEGNSWLALSQDPVNGTWRWRSGPEDGQPLAYNNWGWGEPNDGCCYTGAEDAAFMCFQPVAVPGTWNDSFWLGGFDYWSIGGYVVEYDLNGLEAKRLKKYANEKPPKKVQAYHILTYYPIAPIHLDTGETKGVTVYNPTTESVRVEVRFKSEGMSPSDPLSRYVQWFINGLFVNHSLNLEGYY